MPDRVPGDMPDRMLEDMPDRMPDRMPDKMSDRIPEDMPDKVPECLPDRMPEDMSDRMPEDLPVTKCINVMVGITRSKVFFFKGHASRFDGIVVIHVLLHRVAYNYAVYNQLACCLYTSMCSKMPHVPCSLLPIPLEHCPRFSLAKPRRSTEVGEGGVLLGSNGLALAVMARKESQFQKRVYIMISTRVYAQNSIGYFPIQTLSTCFFGVNPPYDSQMTRLCAEAKSTRSTTTNPVFSRRMSYDSGAWKPREYNHQIYPLLN